MINKEKIEKKPRRNLERNSTVIKGNKHRRNAYQVKKDIEQIGCLDMKGYMYSRFFACDGRVKVSFFRTCLT